MKSTALSLLSLCAGLLLGCTDETPNSPTGEPTDKETGQAAAPAPIIREAGPDCLTSPSPPVRVASPTFAPIDGGPPTPHLKVVDHVVTTAERFVSRSDTWTLTRRGDLARQDIEQHGRKRTIYRNLAAGTELTVASDPPTGFSVLAIRRVERTDDVTYPGDLAGTRDTIIGEPCAEWRTMESAATGSEWLNCITADGIELRQRISGSSWPARIATAVQRRCVSLAEVTPPLAIFDVKRWLDQNDNGMSGADYELAMATRAGAPQRIVRRHKGWTRTEDLHPDGNRSAHVRNPALGVVWQETRNTGGRLIDISIRRSPPEGEDATRRETISQARSELIQGERCWWINAAPGVSDMTVHTCVTNDGIVLAESTTSWGMARPTLRAVSFRRGQVARTAVMPSPDLLDPQTWGFPQG